MKAATDYVGKQLQENPIGWMDVAPVLDAKNVPTRLSYLPDQAGVFWIHYRQWVSEDSYLLVTPVDYLRPYYNGQKLVSPGHYPTTRSTYNLNFVVKLDAQKKQVIILSNLYSTLVDKNLRD